jgi:AmiR/NasT family two-component response regulator
MAEPPRRVVIAADDDRLRQSLREELEALGYVTWGEASDGLAVLSQVRRARPHLVVLVPPLPSLDEAQVAETLIRGELAPVLLLADGEETAEASVRDLSVCARLSRPFTRSALAEAAERARTQFDRLLLIRAELRRLRRERGGTRLLERAKSLLMRRFLIAESEAFWRIQRFCLDSAQPVRTAIESLIEAQRLVIDQPAPPPSSQSDIHSLGD